uniref:BED-type domain-containing protein n=1 Tax=Panagrolaimus sp. JU765 TaxID=591449 RepID=A0AC34R0H9_9BILA
MTGNKRRSKYDDYFTVLSNGDHQCNACGSVIRQQAQRGTSNRLAHLNHCKARKDASNYEPAIKKSVLTMLKADDNDPNQLDRLIVRFVASTGSDLSIVENPYFREIIRFQCSSNTILPNKQKISNFVIDEAEHCLDAIKRRFDVSLPIALQLDEYSNNQTTFIKLSGTQISSFWTINSFHLGVFQVENNESTVNNIQENIEQILNDLEIKNIVGITKNGGRILEN